MFFYILCRVVPKNFFFFSCILERPIAQVILLPDAYIQGKYDDYFNSAMETDIPPHLQIRSHYKDCFIIKLAI